MKHLTEHQRLVIERELNVNTSLRQIGLLVDKHPSTISREIRSRRIMSTNKPYGRTKNACLKRHSCQKKHLCQPCHHPNKSFCCFCEWCNQTCPQFVEEACPKLQHPPYVCNGCSSRRVCTLNGLVYRAKPADQAYRQQRSDIRSGYCLTGEDFQRIDQLVTPRLHRGQSIQFIVRDLGDQLPCSVSTIYRLVNDGELDGVRNINLPRKVRFKPRKAKRSFKVDTQARMGRSWHDYQRFLTDQDHGPLVEMDTLEGRKGGAVFLSLRWPDTGLHLLFWRQANTARSVQTIFDELYLTLGHDRFTRMFGVVLTDNGSEFSNPLALEYAPDGARRTNIFYCNPGSPQEKPSVERGHVEFRKILPKGTSFDDLTQQQVQRIQDHVNSYATKKLNGASPYATFSQLFDDSFAKDLNWTIIDSAFITLKPRLVKC